MKTAEQVIAEYIECNVYFDHDRYPDAEDRSARDAKVIVADLKYNGYIVVKADTLAKQISSAMTGGGAFIE